MRSLLAVFLVGCAVSSDREGPASSALEGLYDVDSYSAADGSCSPLLPQASPFAHIRIDVERVGRLDTLVLRPCSSPDSCSDAEAVYFAEWDDFAAFSSATETEFVGTTCTFRWIETSIEDLDGELVVSSSISEVTGVDGIDLNDCLDQHDAWNGDTPCIGAEQFSAVLAR